MEKANSLQTSTSFAFLAAFLAAYCILIILAIVTFSAVAVLLAYIL